MIPGVLALLLLLVTANLAAMAIVREKELGTLEQLNVTPLRRWELIVGKLLPYGVIAMVDVLLVVAVGACDILSGAVQLGDFGAFLVLASFLYEPVGKLHELNQLVQAGRASGERVFEILDSESEPKGSATFAQPVHGEIEFRDVSFSYSGELPTLTEIEASL